VSGDTVLLDGRSLTIERLVMIGTDPRATVEIADDSLAAVDEAHRMVERAVEGYRSGEGAPIYGVNTGFGFFRHKRIGAEDLERLQRNILLSHSAGVAPGRDGHFGPEVIRMTLAVRLNAFLRGFSGVSRDLVFTLRDMVNRGVIPLVPLQGSVGSSGDLCPLAHLFLPLVGEGRFYLLEEGPGELHQGRELGAILGKDVPCLGPKAGLALTNGATFSAAMLALACQHAGILLDSADIALCLSLEALCGKAGALHPRIHQARGMMGQEESASRMRCLLRDSRLLDRSGDAQDNYSFRCAAQVHGASRDAANYVADIVTREINAATDNPLFFPEEGAMSGGNFHGQPLALAGDFLSIALAELASISERRTQALLDPHFNRNLPANLIARGGLDSGFMIAQYSAASLVSENKSLAHPASVDSIPTSANTEDHNSMATIACRKALRVAENVRSVLAVELLVAAQALEWRVLTERDPVTGPSKEVLEHEAQLFRKLAVPGGSETVQRQLGRGTAPVYRVIRRNVPPLWEDRPLSDDIRAVAELVRTGAVAAAAHEALAQGAARP
jgi:histidine ammonia-lyase